MTNGRLEKELQIQNKIETKLEKYPDIFRGYYLYLRAAGRTYSTINVYMNGIIRFANFICGENINNYFYNNVTTESIESFLISTETTIKNGQITRMSSDARCTYWSYLNTFWEFLIKREYVKENIVNKTNRPKNNSDHSVTYLDRKEIKRLLKSIDDNPDKVMSIRDKTLISVGLATGLRCSAIVNLNIDDIDFENKCMKVVEKENKSRVIDYGDQLNEILKDWTIIRKNNFNHTNSNALFISQKNGRLSVDAANDALKKYARQAGISKHITIHKLRATLACNSLSAGIPILAISKQLGHNSVSTTQRYLDAMSEDKQKLTNFMDKLI